MEVRIKENSPPARPPAFGADRPARGGDRGQDGGFDRNRGGKDRGPRINHMIRVPECRLIGDDGHQYGVIPMNEARRIAEDQGLDLVEVSPNASPPVVKIIDYGKFKYEQQKQANEAKKKQVVVQLKEVQFRPNIEKHDLETKTKKIEGFLEDGDKVKLVMQFRGREMAYKDAGLGKFNEIIKALVELGATIEADPKFMGNRVIAILASSKKLTSRKEQRIKEHEAIHGKSPKAAAEGAKDEAKEDDKE